MLCGAKREKATELPGNPDCPGVNTRTIFQAFPQPGNETKKAFLMDPENQLTHPEQNDRAKSGFNSGQSQSELLKKAGWQEAASFAKAAPLLSVFTQKSVGLSSVGSV